MFFHQLIHTLFESLPLFILKLYYTLSQNADGILLLSLGSSLLMVINFFYINFYSSRAYKKSIKLVDLYITQKQKNYFLND